MKPTDHHEHMQALTSRIAEAAVGHGMADTAMACMVVAGFSIREMPPEHQGLMRECAIELLDWILDDDGETEH